MHNDDWPQKQCTYIILVCSKTSLEESVIRRDKWLVVSNYYVQDSYSCILHFRKEKFLSSIVPYGS